MSDGASALAPSTTPDSSMPPYNTAGAGDILGTPAQGPLPQPQAQPQAQPQPPQTTPASQDPEMVSGAHHQSWLAHVMDTVGNILGGDTTLHVTKHPDGSVEVTHDPSTEGEKWGRVAAAALGGAAKGLEVGQGPGGPARAAAAGAQTGLAQPQQRLDAANQEATAEQQTMARNANNAILNQKVVQGAWDNAHLSRDDLQKQQDYALKHMKELDDAGITPIMTGVKDGHTLAVYGIANPNAVGAHMGQDGSMIFNEPDGEGGVNIYQVSGDQANSPTKEPDTWELTKLDPKDPTNTITEQHTTAAGEKVGARATRRMALVVQNDNAIKTAFTNKMTQQERQNQGAPKTLPEYNLAISRESDPQKKADLIAARDTTFKEEMQLRQAGRNVTTPATPQAISNWGALLSDPKSGVTLANVRPQDRNAVIEQMRQSGQKIGKPLTQAELNRSDLAGNAVDNIEEAQRILEKKPDMFGPSGFGKTQFQKLIAGGDPDAMAFLTAINLANLPAVGIHGVKGKYALEDLSKLDSNLYLNADSMRNVLSEIHRSASDFKGYGGRQLETPPAPGGTTAAAPAAGGNASQAARAPGAPPQLPAPQPTGEIRMNPQTRQYKQLQGSQWVDVAPPPAR